MEASAGPCRIERRMAPAPPRMGSFVAIPAPRGTLVGSFARFRPRAEGPVGSFALFATLCEQPDHCHPGRNGFVRTARHDRSQHRIRKAGPEQWILIECRDALFGSGSRGAALRPNCQRSLWKQSAKLNHDTRLVKCKSCVESGVPLVQDGLAPLNRRGSIAPSESKKERAPRPSIAASTRIS